MSEFDDSQDLFGDEDASTAVLNDETETNVKSQLINQIRIHPCLWKMSEALYSDKNARSNAWTEISANLNISEKAAKTTWKGLCTIFLRNKKKRVWKTGMGLQSDWGESAITWPYWRQMDFLLSKKERGNGGTMSTRRSTFANDVKTAAASSTSYLSPLISPTSDQALIGSPEDSSIQSPVSDENVVYCSSSALTPANPNKRKSLLSDASFVIQEQFMQKKSRAIQHQIISSRPKKSKWSSASRVLIEALDDFEETSPELAILANEQVSNVLTALKLAHARLKKNRVADVPIFGVCGSSKLSVDIQQSGILTVSENFKQVYADANEVPPVAATVIID